jgi:hypothetical protein
MTSSTRYVLLGGTGVLAAGVAAGLVAYYAGVPALGALAGAPPELVYVPEQASVVAFADVRQVVDSEFRRQIRELLPEPATAAEAEGRRHVQETTGIDIERDVDHVLMYLMPAGDAEGDDQALVFVRGRFDPDRIEQLIAEHGGVAETYRGKRVIVRRFDAPTPAPPAASPDVPGPTPGAGRPDMAVGFIQAGLIAVGTRAALVRAIDLESGGGIDITRNDAFMALVRDSDDGDVWAVGRFDRLVGAGNGRVPREIMDRLPAITYFAATGSVGSTLSGRLRAETRDEEAATQLNDVVRGGVALVRMQTSGRPELDSLLQSIQLQSDGNAVVLSFSLPAGALQALLPKRGSDSPPSQ